MTCGNPSGEGRGRSATFPAGEIRFALPFATELTYGVVVVAVVVVEGGMKGD